MVPSPTAAAYIEEFVSHLHALKMKAEGVKAEVHNDSTSPHLQHLAQIYRKNCHHLR